MAAGSVCVLFKKTKRRRFPEDRIRFSSSRPRPYGVTSITGGRVELGSDQATSPETGSREESLPAAAGTDHVAGNGDPTQRRLAYVNSKTKMTVSQTTHFCEGNQVIIISTCFRMQDKPLLMQSTLWGSMMFEPMACFLVASGKIHLGVEGVGFTDDVQNNQMAGCDSGAQTRSFWYCSCEIKENHLYLQLTRVM
ncbi:hypothetical protein VPH35_060690 [Triticum aestivum]|uniref:Uncharacterized protein n=1 Tax=Aegilops tauschii TaxID=37682 RepID=M8BVW4_AEGTA